MYSVTFILFFNVFRATDDVFQLLEDNQVTLSTMKASRYVKAFETEVFKVINIHGERTLLYVDCSY